MNLKELSNKLSGELFYDNSPYHQAVIRVYATDASAYQEMPHAVAMPKDKEDIKALIHFSQEHNITLIPRAAGTSLAGQVVGSGIVVDVSKYMNGILELNEDEKWVRVQPGVVRDELNKYLYGEGLMFAPETSTANRAMIGGMIGNNSCGLHSMIYGSTRDHLLEVSAILSDGSEAVFTDLTLAEAEVKRNKDGFEGKIYEELLTLLQSEKNQNVIRESFPQKDVRRRNSGYALDRVAGMVQHKNIINLSQIIAGSEGTLCFITGAKLNLIDLPPKEVGVVAIHCSSIRESLLANLIAVKHSCAASELVDRAILNEALDSPSQAANRDFIKDTPGAILMVEFYDNDADALLHKCNLLINELREAKLGYHYPILLGKDTEKAWELRKAGLGLLRNLKGDTQPVNLIEDCAVSVENLPDYIQELELLLQQKGLQYSMYAHAGDGELHVEPMINLKTAEGKQVFEEVLTATVELVKKYGGSLSGEHGDGRLRGQFIADVMGGQVYELFKKIKLIFDPQDIFNKGKITSTPGMTDNLRFQPATKIPLKTFMDFSAQENILRLTEKCSGSGDCRKTQITGGTMCPSYMVTRNEKDTTRARANILRQYLSQEPETFGKGKFADMAKDVLDLCIACKGCKIECPSSVDMTKLRAEFLFHYQQQHGVTLRTRLVSSFSKLMKLASIFPGIYNSVIKNDLCRSVINRLIGFHPDRSLPALEKSSLMEWYHSRLPTTFRPGKLIYFFCDEFTNYNDVNAGKKMILLLEHLGYQVIIPEHTDSGRAQLSKGLLAKARRLAEKNVSLLADTVTAETPMIGLEPSAILSFRDEYPDLVSPALVKHSKELAKHTFLFEEWFYSEIEKGNISKEQFVSEERHLIVHGHCHQKALSSMKSVLAVLNFPENFKAELIPSGCCGMAGSFGYEKEHFELSMKIGGLVLFPAVNNKHPKTMVIASGTSCRHQLKDGTGEIAYHPAEVLYDALVKDI
ncbi:MAG TPA: FAD-linked oxidase C-terminal domain-containing protein [Mucilaginibacter sp.]|jgi:FAD/FMN-containing dehydrogenase/Fe-S oxidoreductase